MDLQRWIPATVVRRARLAFLALGLLAVVLAWIQLAVIAGGSDLQAWAVLAVAAILLTWNRVYRTGNPSWWADLVVAGSVLVYLMALPLPDLGLGLVYIAVYMGALYGSRAESARALVLVVAAYVGAEIAAGAIQSEIIRLFMFFQLPALVVTGLIIRALHESLATQESLSDQVERLIRMEAVIRLTGGIAHDFNNLLTTILGSLDLALDELDRPDELREDLGRARETTLSARSLTSRLLEFSRTAAVTPTEVVLDERLRSIEPILGKILGSDAELTLRASSDGAVVLIDPGSLDQVMRQLVENARAGMEGEPEPKQVSIRSRRCPVDQVPPELIHVQDPPDTVSTGYVVVSVEDTGAGMSPDVRERAFEPFFSTREGSTGLGLSTVYGIVTRAGGQVILDDHPGGGTIVRIYLPIHGTAPPTDRRESQPEEAETPGLESPASLG